MSALTLNALRRVGPREWPEVVAVTLIATVVEVGLATMPLPRVARALGAPLVTGPTASATTTSSPRLSPRARSQVRVTRKVMRHWPFGDTCLRQALVAGHRLRRLDPCLRVGVAKVDGEVRAHAWLEIYGAVLDPMGAAGAYAPILPLVENS